MKIRQITLPLIQLNSILMLLLLLVSFKITAQQFLRAPDSYVYVAENTLIKFDNTNVYFENFNMRDDVDVLFENTTYTSLYFAGDTTQFGRSNWTYGTATVDFNFVSSPQQEANLVNIDAPNENFQFTNLNLLIPDYSLVSDLVLNETSELTTIQVTDKLTFPEGNFLFLGDKSSNSPQTSDTSNTMTLTLANANTTINDNQYTRDYFIVTPGRSRLGRFIPADNTETIFPIGDNKENYGFAPVSITNQVNSADAIFYATASAFLYDWDTSFRSNEEIANPVINRRQNNVKKHWILRSNIDNRQLNVKLKLQHADNVNIQEEQYEPELRTLISRYVGTPNNVLNRNNMLFGDISVKSYSYWENLDFRTKLYQDNITGVFKNIVGSTVGAFTHETFITDFSNVYPIYMKAGLAEDSTPMGAKMRLPLWDSLSGTHGGNILKDNDVITFNFAKRNSFKTLISSFTMYYTTSKIVAEQNFPSNLSSQFVIKPDFEADENNLERSDFIAPAYSTSDTMYFKLVPVPAGIPYTNVSYEYLESPIGIIPPDLSGNSESIFVVNNPINTASDDNIVALLPRSLTAEIESGMCYFIEPISKVTIHRKPLERVGSSFGFQTSVSNTPIAPGVYVIVIRAKMKDGSEKDFMEKVLIQ